MRLCEPDWPGFLPPPIEPCMRFSRTRLTDVLHRRHSASPSPRPVGPRPDDGSVEADQPEAVRPGGERLPAEAPMLLMTLGDQQRQARVRVTGDRVELDGRVAVAEVARPAAQEPVEVTHDLLDRPAQPVPRRELAHTVAGVPHGLARGPAGEERDVAVPGVAGAHPAVVEAEEVEPLASFPQVHDPRLGLLGLEAQVGQDRRERPKGGLGFPAGLAHRDEIIGVAAERPVPAPGGLDRPPVGVLARNQLEVGVELGDLVALIPGGGGSQRLLIEEVRIGRSLPNIPHADLKAKLSGFADAPPEDLYHYEFIFDPHSRKQMAMEASAPKVPYKPRVPTPKPRWIVRDKNGYAPGINILRLVGLFRFVPPRIVTGFQFKQYRKVALLDGVRGSPGQIYTSSIYYLEGYIESAYAVSVRDAPATIDISSDLAREMRLPSINQVRLCRASQARWASPSTSRSRRSSSSG